MIRGFFYTLSTFTINSKINCGYNLKIRIFVSIFSTECSLNGISIEAFKNVIRENFQKQNV